MFRVERLGDVWDRRCLLGVQHRVDVGNGGVRELDVDGTLLIASSHRLWLVRQALLCSERTLIRIYAFLD